MPRALVATRLEGLIATLSTAIVGAPLARAAARLRAHVPHLWGEAIMASIAAGISALKPIEGASAWIGATLKQQPDSWIYRLSDAEIAELDDATRAARRSGLDLADMRRQDFSLPHLGPVLERLRDEVLNG